MAVMAEARWLGEHSPRNRMHRYDILCVHTIVGYAPAHAAHFSNPAHGPLMQSRDTAYQSAANLYGNPRVIAMECEDHGSAFDGMPRTRAGIPALNENQLENAALLLKWCNRVHAIPMQLAPNSLPGSRGLAYHRQGCEGNFSGYRFPGRVSGGELWSSAPGKVCPDDLRIAQLPEIIERAKGMEVDWERLERLIRKVVREETPKAKINVGKENAWSLETVLKTLVNRGGKA